MFDDERGSVRWWYGQEEKVAGTALIKDFELYVCKSFSFDGDI